MAVCVPPGKLLGQTLFLGASVSSFNANMGWGGSDTRITVELVDDNQPSACYVAGFPLPAYPTNLEYGDNHYYECGAPANDSCYVNERGEPYDSNALPAHATRNVPGKLYYLWAGNRYVSKYWAYEDPGFFAVATRVAPDGTLDDKRKYTYNIIGVPVIFKLGDFTFSGIIESWERTNHNGSISYSVSIVGPETLLNESYVILDKYPGSIFGKMPNKTYGGPKNYIGPLLEYSGQIAEGVIPNVFNVYGFLESLNINNFGGANKSTGGIPSVYALDALSVLTCCANASLLHGNNKTAFSPFGRIISKTMETTNSIRIKPAFNTYSFGVIPPTSDTHLIVSDVSAKIQTPRCVFALDLSDIKRPPLEHRIDSGQGIMRVSDFIDYIVQAGGRDRQTRGLSFSDGDKVYNIIKINTIDRSVGTNSLTVANTISSLEKLGIPVGSTSYGQEKNRDCKSRVMIIGGPQQRLLQAKNYRLAYTQTNYIYHATIGKFVDLNRFNGIYGGGKIRIPSYFSTRNKDISVHVLGQTISSLFNDEESLREQIYENSFASLDDVWKDNEIANDAEDVTMGNYPGTVGIEDFTTCKKVSPKPTEPVLKTEENNDIIAYISTGYNWAVDKIDINSKQYKDANAPTPPVAYTPNNGNMLDNACIPIRRLNPLWFDTISPFFGHHYDNVIQINEKSNSIDMVRPVYQDSWDGQLVVGFHVNEIPLLGLGFTELPDHSMDPTAVTGVGTGGGLQGGKTASTTYGPPLPPTPPTPYPSGFTGNSALPANYIPHTGVGFVIKETEFRCAMAGHDAYIAYCFGKSKDTKPDLYNILVGHYVSKGLFFAPTPLGGFAIDLGTGLQAGGGVSVAPSTKPNRVAKTKSGGIDLDAYLNHNFTKDLMTISNFVRSIAERYYGKKYLVKLIGMSVYKDEIYTRSNIQVGYATLPVFQGNRIVNRNYDLADFAWEEPGNFLDDMIIVGDENYYTLCKDDQGSIPPIVGYNSTKNIDYLKFTYCSKLISKLAPESAKRKQLMERLEAIKILIKTGLLTQIELEALLDEIKYRQDKLDIINKKIKELNRMIGGYIGCDPSVVASLSPASLRANIRNVISSPNFITDSLNLSKLSADETFVHVATNGRTDAFNNIIEYGSSKLYCTTTCDTIVYLDPYEFSQPRAIINGKGIPLENSSHSYIHDPNLTVISNIALEDLIHHVNTEEMTGIPMDPKLKIYLEYLATFTNVVFGKEAKNGTIEQIAYQGAPANSSYFFETLAPKMAHPLFAGVPLTSNQHCYGPWTNYPSVRSDLIYPNAFNSKIAMENMLSDVDVQYEPDLVPWAYGGMAFLDAKVVSELDYRASFQEVSENGRVTIQGPPFFNLGGRFEPLLPLGTILPKNSLAYGNEVYQISNAPIFYRDEKRSIAGGIPNYPPRLLKYPITAIRSINTSVGVVPPIVQSISLTTQSDGLSSTSYSFGSYDRKKGTYGKQHADAVRNRTKDLIQSNSLMNKNNAIRTNTFLIDSQKLLQAMKDVNLGDHMGKYGTKLYGSSPVETLIGRASPYAPFPFVPNQCSDIGAGGEALTPSGLYRAGRTSTWVGLYTGDEVGAELINGYESKSAMSLDGLLSPISFYPTQHAGTYAISSHITGVPIGSVVCPRCLGDGNILMTFINYNIDSLPSENIKYPCPACSRSKLVVKNAKLKDSLKNKTAAQQIAIALKDTKPEINIYAYNPIVVPYGEFRNPNAQTVVGASGLGLDKCRHSISIVGRSEMPIGGNLTLGIHNNLYGGKLVGLDGKIASTGVSSDYYEHDILNEVGGGPKTLQNQRFFGLRGPLMLHSWGYDTAGYPVPNLNDEPKDMDQYGRFRRFILTSGGLNDYKKEGVYINKEGDLLGDIVGRNYEWDPAAVKYKKIKAKPSKYFHLNWAERPELWPVGPIDLRWDDSRKVWAAGGGGCTEELLPPSIITNSTDISTLNEFLSSKESNTCPYKMVNITLEEDLIKEDDSDETYATRGFIDDIEYSKEPLTRGYRRLVYVVDKAGYSAPRGTKLLCKYSIDSGFYEPISKPVTMAKGKIVNSTNVKIEQHYIQGRRAGIVPSFVVPFDNPMEFQTTSGKNGMFVYINGKWTLTSIKN